MPQYFGFCSQYNNILIHSLHSHGVKKLDVWASLYTGLLRLLLIRYFRELVCMLLNLNQHNFCNTELKPLNVNPWESPTLLLHVLFLNIARCLLSTYFAFYFSQRGDYYGLFPTCHSVLHSETTSACFTIIVNPPMYIPVNSITFAGKLAMLTACFLERV